MFCDCGAFWLLFLQFCRPHALTRLYAETVNASLSKDRLNENKSCKEVAVDLFAFLWCRGDTTSLNFHICEDIEIEAGLRHDCHQK